MTNIREDRRKCLVCGEPQTDVSFASVHKRGVGAPPIQVGIMVCSKHTWRDLEPDQYWDQVIIEVPQSKAKSKNRG